MKKGQSFRALPLFFFPSVHNHDIKSQFHPEYQGTLRLHHDQIGHAHRGMLPAGNESARIDTVRSIP